MTADTRSAIDTTRELITEAVCVGLRQWAALGIDGTPGVTLGDFLAVCIAEALAEHTWIPKAAYDAEQMAAAMRDAITNGDHVARGEA